MAASRAGVLVADNRSLFTTGTVEGAYPLKTRTLRSLLEGIERQQRMSA